MLENDTAPVLLRNASTITDPAGTTRKSPINIKNGATPATFKRPRGRHRRGAGPESSPAPPPFTNSRSAELADGRLPFLPDEGPVGRSVAGCGDRGRLAERR